MRSDATPCFLKTRRKIYRVGWFCSVSWYSVLYLLGPHLDSSFDTNSCFSEHLLCKHAFISPKRLNRRFFTVQNPLLVGLPIGLQKVNVLCASLDKASEKCIRFESRKHFTGRTVSARLSRDVIPCKHRR